MSPCFRTYQGDQILSWIDSKVACGKPKVFTDNSLYLCISSREPSCHKMFRSGHHGLCKHSSHKFVRLAHAWKLYGDFPRPIQTPPSLTSIYQESQPLCRAQRARTVWTVDHTVRGELNLILQFYGVFDDVAECYAHLYCDENER